VKGLLTRDMATVAEQLRLARESKHLTLQQVAEITKIRSDHLTALEEGNFNVFPAPVYIRGFVRCYSTLLKLDVPRLMGELDGELGQTRQFSEPPALSARPRGIVDFLTLQLSKVDWRKGLVVISAAVVLTAAVLVILIVRHYRNSDPLKNLPPGVYQPARPGMDYLPSPPGPATSPKKK
jgi:cytoskeletal protein RodZ